uniref:Uncharacterized protein n=1 Tax=Salmo trutta TaxID=8032 RepID=A0A673X8L7_SALTR
MVHSLNRKIQCLSSPEDLRRALFTQSSTLISTIIEAVSTKVQRLFEAPADYIPLSSIRSWLSEPKASEVRPKCPDQLVISSELLRTIIGMIVYLVFEGHLEEDINLHYWPLINDIIHQLSLCGVKVTKKGGKANWHIGWYQILEMGTNIHTHLRHYTGRELVLKLATSARATMLTRCMVHHVVEELVKLKDCILPTGFATASCPPPPGFAPASCPPPPGFALLSCPPPPGFAQASCPPPPGFALALCPPPPGFAPASCHPPPGFALALCPPPPGFAPLSCPPPPGFAPLSCPPPPGFALALCPPPPGFAQASCPPRPGFDLALCPPPPGFSQASCPPPPGFAPAWCPPPPGFAPASWPLPPGFAPASCPPPPGFAPASCHPPLTFAEHICTLIQSITARSNNIVNKELEKCINSYSKTTITSVYPYESPLSDKNTNKCW